MEFLMILSKYNTRQGREEGKLLLVVYYLNSILTSLTIIVERIYEEWGRIY